jgi:hypothetical protein
MAEADEKRTVSALHGCRASGALDRFVDFADFWGPAAGISYFIGFCGDGSRARHTTEVADPTSPCPNSHLLYRFRRMADSPPARPAVFSDLQVALHL